MARIIGLTGGIASGKSTVAKLLVELGAALVDADQVARAVVEPGTPTFSAIVEAFGEEVLGADGTLDRKALAAIVFSDQDARRRLNGLIHPAIAAESARRIGEKVAEGADPVIYDAALIVENNLHRGLDGLIVVAAQPATQIDRLMNRDHVTADEAQARIGAQLPLADKLAVATHVIQNDGDLASLQQQTQALWANLSAPRVKGPT